MHFLCNFFSRLFWFVFFFLHSCKQKRACRFVAVHYSHLSFWWTSVRGSHRMDFFLHWICKPIVICNINQERRIKERGWKIFLTVKRTSAALGTIKHVSTGLSGDFRRLDARRIIYIPVTSHLFVFWCWPSPHSHLQEWRIHPPLWGRQPAFLTPTVHSPGCPTSPSARQCVASWWGRAWDICGYLSCTYLANMLHHLSLLLAFLLRVSRAASLHSALTLSH